VPPSDPALEASMTSFPSGTIQGLGYLARPKGGGPYPAVLIIHENRGLEVLPALGWLVALIADSACRSG